MVKFIKKLCSFIVNLIVIGLILLVSIQIIVKDESASRQLEKFEMVIRDVLGQENRLVEVSKTTNIKETTGIMVVDLLQDLNLSQVWLLRNGVKVANFADGVAVVEVKSGDIISIDSTLYSRPLWFEITSLSASISTWQVGKQFRITGDNLNLGIVKFENKL